MCQCLCSSMLQHSSDSDALILILVAEQFLPSNIIALYEVGDEILLLNLDSVND